MPPTAAMVGALEAIAPPSDAGASEVMHLAPRLAGRSAIQRPECASCPRVSRDTGGKPRREHHAEGTLLPQSEGTSVTSPIRSAVRGHKDTRESSPPRGFALSAEITTIGRVFHKVCSIPNRDKTFTSTSSPASDQMSPRELQQEQQPHALGWMFRPLLDKKGLLSLTSEVLCQPGYTSGPADEQQLLRRLKTGRLDVRNMSRILRWLGGQRAESELLRRGITFVGPRGKSALHPYTTGLGMSRLAEIISSRHPPGSRFVVCFSSSFEACAGVVAGVLARGQNSHAASAVDGDDFDDAGTTMKSVVANSHDQEGGGCFTRTPSYGGTTSSTCSLSDHEDAGGATRLALRWQRRAHVRDINERTAAYTPVAGGADVIEASGLAADGGTPSCAKGKVEAFLLDEKPKHRRAPGDVGVSDDEGVVPMTVRDWVDNYGDCEGPLLAAWVYGAQGDQPAQ